MIINNPEYFENEMLEEVDRKISDVSEMIKIERQFVNGIIRQLKPKRILEVGIAAGSSTVVILNAIKDLDNSFLYSIDYNTQYYKDNTKLSGYMIDDIFHNDEIKNKWKLFTGGVSARFMEDIGGDIDLCILDTMHSNPGEILDFLMILPYLKTNATIIIHDIEFHTIEYNHRQTCSILFSTLTGKKIIPTGGELKFGYPNIGAVVLSENIKEEIHWLFKLLTLRWIYEPSEKDNKDILETFNKNYGSRYALLYQKIYFQHSIHLNKLSNTNISNNIEYNISNINNKLEDTIYNINWIKLFGIYNNKEHLKIVIFGINIVIKMDSNKINRLAWFIPVRKWRYNFRKKFE